LWIAAPCKQHKARNDEFKRSLNNFHFLRTEQAMQNLINKIFFILILCLVSSCYAIKVGIILPIEHQALKEISQGFQDTLQQLYNKPIKFKIGNAQGDINLQRAIITQMRDANYDLIVPISTSVTQMTASIINSKPIVGLAVDMNDKKDNLVIVDDEIDNAKIITFIQKVYPHIKNITLVHSATNKIFTQVEQIKSISKIYHVNVHCSMIQSLADLYSISQMIPVETQAIFVLKDNLVVSGIETLMSTAKERKIPLITSDEGTVQKGAGFALGVHEKDIGIAGAKLAAQILCGAVPGVLATVKITKPTVFINAKTLLIEGHSIDKIKQAAKQLNYPVEIIK